MTANGAEPSEPSTAAAGVSVRIRSTVYLFGNYEMKATQPGELTRDFITLILTVKGAKTQEVSLCLSFKHIVRVDLLDNSENEGAGMVVYMNNFMAKRIEKLFHFEQNSFLNFRNPYLNHAFIVFDIVNSDRTTISTLKQVLNDATDYHKEYLLNRFKAENDPEPENRLPKNYIFPMTSKYWKGLLATMHKDFFVEELTVGSNDGKDITYASGYIINLVSTNKCAVQADGRIMPVNSDQPDSILAVRRRPLDHQQPRTFNLGRIHQQDGPNAKMTRFVTTTQPILRPKIDEVHTIEDDQAQDQPHNAEDTVVCTYQPIDRVLCKINFNDLATLGQNEMLNDTIIDFYMNYILHDLVPPEVRDEIYIFNSFFYTKLSKGLTIQRVLKTRSKRIAENYAMLKNWTKNVNIFAKNYIVVPINEDTHWYLAVIVNPSIGFVTSKEGTSNGAQDAANAANSNASQQPQVPVFIFDSLIDAESVKKHRTVAETLLEYLQLEFRDKKNEHQLQGVAYRKNACRIVTPEQTPQQQNHFDCGVFMLQFAESFLTRLPKFDDVPNVVSYEQLFGTVDLNGKREYIRQLISDMSSRSSS